MADTRTSTGKRGLTPYTLEMPALRETIIGLLAEGKSLRVTAAEVGCTWQAITKFRKRHLPAIEARKAALAAQVQDVWLREKEARIRRYAQLHDDMAALVEERGSYEATDYKLLGTGEDAQVIEIKRFDAALVQQMRGSIHDAAEELDDLPRGTKDGVINVALNVNLTWDDGSPA